MEIKYGKIIKITDKELYEFWLEHWSDFYSYNDYKTKCIELGTKVVDEND